MAGAAFTQPPHGFVQVIAPEGTVVAASANVEGEAPLASDG
jgi:hypothetical protein